MSGSVMASKLRMIMVPRWCYDGIMSCECRWPTEVDAEGVPRLRMSPTANVAAVVVVLYGFRLGTLLGLFRPRVIAGSFPYRAML